jgi:hypothetical protein
MSYGTSLHYEDAGTTVLFGTVLPLNQCFGSGSGFNQVSGSGSGFEIRIRIQEGKNDLQKKEKIKKFHVLKCWMFSFEG